MKDTTHSAMYNTPLGEITITEESGAVTSVSFGACNLHKSAPSELTNQTYKELLEYFCGDRKDFSVPFSLHGTDFQNKVWLALLDIPYGETKTYGEIAKIVGLSRGARAVGLACNRNPIAILVPCHRVIGANGNLTGYAGGLNIKRSLLDIESRNK
jgi:methylated-DNA-[protein]-cysteine S-methyltransferase